MSDRPRITFSRSQDGSFEIYLNPAGRDLFVRQLHGLSEHSDHFHIMPEDMGPELPARNRPYSKGAEIMEWGKVLLRPDEWDREHFPHVLDESDTDGR